MNLYLAGSSFSGTTVACAPARASAGATVDRVTLGETPEKLDVIPPSMQHELKAVGAVGSAVVVGEEVGRLEFTDDKSLSLSVVYPDGFKQKVDASQVQVPETEASTARVSVLKNLGVRHAFSAWLGRHSDMFPRLDRKDWEAIAPRTDEYNCIAESVGENEQNLWPGPSVADFDKLYGDRGFVPVDGLDYALQPEIEKVVLFGLKPGDRDYEVARLGLVAEGRAFEPAMICTHAIRQRPDGSYYSKNGGLEKIKILNPSDLGGGFYGEPIKVYARKRDPLEAQ